MRLQFVVLGLIVTFCAQIQPATAADPKVIPFQSYTTTGLCSAVHFQRQSLRLILTDSAWDQAGRICGSARLWRAKHRNSVQKTGTDEHGYSVCQLTFECTPDPFEE